MTFLFFAISEHILFVLLCLFVVLVRIENSCPYTQCYVFRFTFPSNLAADDRVVENNIYMRR